MKDHRKYIKCLYVYNKIDSIGLPHLDELAREPNTVVMSCELDLGIQDVVDRCWEELRLIRIYTWGPFSFSLLLAVLLSRLTHVTARGKVSILISARL